MPCETRDLMIVVPKPPSLYKVIRTNAWDLYLVFTAQATPSSEDIGEVPTLQKSSQLRFLADFPALFKEKSIAQERKY